MISIIVPVYNAERYLYECLDSIKNQKYDDIEVIMVNDGSTDDSRIICEAMSETDSRFKVVNISNHGVCYARNIGLKIATGEYIAFVDADDKLDSDFLAFLYCKMTEYNADISVCDFYNENGLESPHWNDMLYEKKDIIPAYLRDVFYNRIMNKLYRKAIISDVSFPVDRNILEDAYWTSTVLSKCNCVYLAATGKYYYRITDESLSHRKMSEEEEVGSFRNAIDKFKTISENIQSNDTMLLVKKIMERIPWMLLSGSDLNLFDTYVTMRSLVGTALLRDVSNVEFNIIRENEFYRKAQQKYYLYTMKKKV